MDGTLHSTQSQILSISSYRTWPPGVLLFTMWNTAVCVGKVAGRLGGGEKTHHQVSHTTTGKIKYKTNKKPLSRLHTANKQYIYYPVHSHLSLIGQFNTPAARQGGFTVR
jgi:hypothetical protein